MEVPREYNGVSSVIILGRFESCTSTKPTYLNSWRKWYCLIKVPRVTMEKFPLNNGCGEIHSRVKEKDSSDLETFKKKKKLW